MNYRQEWAEGDIEVGTLLDAIDELQDHNQKLIETLSEIMKVMPCLPPNAELIKGMPARYEAAIKQARAVLKGIKGTPNV